MKTKIGILGFATLFALQLPVLAAESKGQDKLVPAPTGSRVPEGGESNPTRRKSEENIDTGLGTSLGKSPVEVDKKELVQSDAGFLKEADQSGLAEITASRMAAARATDPKVRGYAAHLVDEHEAMAADLKKVAMEKNVELATKLDAKRQATADRLGKLQGAAFDKAYIEQMTSDHQSTVEFFERGAMTSKDDDTRALIGRSLPMLRKHGEMAKAMYNATGK